MVNTEFLCFLGQIYVPNVDSDYIDLSVYIW